MAATGLQCRACGRTYGPQPIYVCEACLGPLEAIYAEMPEPDVMLARIAEGPRSLWRYADMLPVAYDPAVDLGAGFTPLVPAPNLGRALGIRRLFLKNDSCNPTWSFKDRVVEMGVAAARRFGLEVVACASTGNLANSVAAHAARAGMAACVFVPNGLEAGKLLLSAVYGAVIVEVNGNYDDVNRLCAEIAEEYPWAFLNVNVRPYYSEGGKTLAYEVAEQLGWNAPDHVVVPMASGNLLLKVAKGFRELQEWGLLENGLPRVHGVQPEGCSPIVAAFRSGSATVQPVRPHTIAHSLAIGNPADGRYALEVIAESGGIAEAVPDEETVDSILLLARTEGIFTETAGGVTVGALRRLARAGQFQDDDVVVAYITGMGLKTQEAVAGAVPAVTAIPATMKAFEREVLPRIESGTPVPVGAARGES